MTIMAKSTAPKRIPAVSAQVVPGRVLDEAFWEQLWGDPNPSMRDKIIALTYEGVARIGPSTFNIKLVCEELGISYSLINHHFGSRDELLAETTVIAYERYISVIWAAAKMGTKPKERLRNWIEASISWSSTASGWGAILNYPTASLDVTELITERYKQKMADMGQLNLARLLQLIVDVKKNKVSEKEYELGKLPLASILANTRSLYLMSSIGWSVLGVAVWSAGRHLPTGQTVESRMHEKMAVKVHIDRIINQIDGIEID